MTDKHAELYYFLCVGLHSLPQFHTATSAYINLSNQSIDFVCACSFIGSLDPSNTPREPRTVPGSLPATIARTNMLQDSIFSLIFPQQPFGSFSPHEQQTSFQTYISQSILVFWAQANHEGVQRLPDSNRNPSNTGKTAEECKSV